MASQKKILEKNLRENPQTIYEEFTKSYNDNYPSDVRMMKGTDESDETNNKSALQRCKSDKESNVQKEVLM